MVDQVWQSSRKQESGRGGPIPGQAALQQVGWDPNILFLDHSAIGCEGGTH
jgi:hypothetical protein